MADLGNQKRHKRINLTDPEARRMKGRQGIVAGYNAQAMVSPMETAEGAAGMVVTAVDVVDAANDNALLVPMIEQAEETTRTRVPMTLADAGYFAVSHLVLQRRFLNLVSFWPEIASRKARQQSCQARGQVAMKRCSRSISCEQSL